MVAVDPYVAFIAGKFHSAPAVGIEDHPPISDLLFPHQRALVEVALRKGRYAVFADTGLGKGWVELEWCRIVSLVTGKPTLLLAPLAVSRQFEREAAKLGAEIRVVSQASEVGPGINVTNYHKLHRFDPAVFGGVALDESSILKSFDGRTRTALIEAFRETPFRLAATATPSPNDHAELGNHAEFLGVMSRVEMLSMFFVHDGASSASTGGWRLKGHAKDAFWRWVASWAASLRKPSDLGFPNDGYDLPPLTIHEHVIAADVKQAHSAGLLFPEPASTLIDQRRARRGTLDERVRVAAEIVNEHDRPAIVWCDLNDEGDAIEKAVRGAVQIAGKDDDDAQESKFAAFLDGKARVLVTKASIAGFGLNLQHCSDVVFVGVSHSFEQWYQAIRRCWRFGQQNEVDVHIVTSELEGRVLENLKRKQKDADEMAQSMVAAMSDFCRAEIGAPTGRQTIEYAPSVEMRIPEWLTSEVRT